MAVSRETAEKIVRWHMEFGCKCDNGTRLERVLGMLGGGVNAASVRNRPFLETREDTQVPAKISNIISQVLKERSLTNPQMATAIFKRNGKRYSFCDCSDQRGNCSVTVMTAWFNDNDDKDIEVTCPSCADDYSKRRGSTMKKSMPLISMLTATASSTTITTTDNISEQLMSMSLSTTGGCGRNSQARLSSFNGSWAGLTYNIENKTIDGEILMSNVVFSSCRLQPSCSCSEILYIVSSIIGDLEGEDLQFAFRASEVKILGGGEFLYIKYPIFREGSVFDRVFLPKAMKKLLFSEPNGFAVSETIKDEGDEEKDKPKIHVDSGNSSSSSKLTDSPPLPPPKTLHENIVDMEQLMSMMLSKGNNNSRRKSKKRKRDNSLMTTQLSSSFLLPSPQIDEKCITHFQDYLSNIATETVRIRWPSGDSHILPIKRLPETGKKVLYPSKNTILSPPLIMRTKYNSYIVISGLLMFFDHVENETSCVRTSLNDNAAHKAVFRLLSRIRESSLRKSVAAINKEGAVHLGLGLSVKDLPPKDSSGVSLSQSEIERREISSTTTLNILSSLVK